MCINSFQRIVNMMRNLQVIQYHTLLRKLVGQHLQHAFGEGGAHEWFVQSENPLLSFN